MKTNERTLLKKDPVVIKGLTIFLLILLLLIPLAMIGKTVDDRARTSRYAESELIKEFGGEQVVNGPLIIIPYIHFQRDIYGNIIDQEKHKAYFLPETLKISGDIRPEIRNRGIYEFMLYTGDLNLQGSFKKPDFTKIEHSVDKILWDEAYIEVEISDMKGLREKPEIVIDGEKQSMKNELSRSGIFYGGLKSLLDISNSTENILFETDLSIQGGNSLRFVPSGDETTIDLTSNWKDPSFFGSYLPRKHSIDEERGFNAQWYIMSFSRDFSDVMEESAFKNVYFDDSYFGVKLMIPVDIYQLTERCVKYGVLFLILPFLTFFLFEIFSGVKVHPFHYLFVGIAACLFFLLLIALSEHFTFITAFIAGVISVSALITYYTCYFLKSIKRGLVIFPIMLIAYFFMYIMINSEDYALLMGSIGTFTIVAGVMIVTRKVDWYNVGKDKTNKIT